jgi:hypothetical protein
MVCAKCQKKPQSTTALATPEVKKKNDMYYGSPATGSSKAGTKTSATLGNNGIGKVGRQSFALCIAMATDIEPAE